MALVKRCDVTLREITGFDAGEGPMICRTPDGYVIRVEVMPGEDGERHHLREEAVKRMIEHNALFPEDQEEAGVTKLPVRGRA